MTVVSKPRIALGITALAGLTALGGVGAVLHDDASDGAGPARINVTEVATTTSKPDTSTSESTDTSESSTSESTPTSPSDSGAEADLVAMLPRGYSASNCSSTQLIGASVATVVCSQASVANGPSSAWFAIFSSQDDLDDGFGILTGEDELAPCPEGGDSPGPWSYNSNSDEPAGQIACGTYKGEPDLIWTQNAELMLGAIQGGSPDSLYNYWTNPGGSGEGITNRQRT